MDDPKGIYEDRKILSGNFCSACRSWCGEFNGWDPKVNPMKAHKDGSFSTTVSLKPGQEYRFRYLLDGERWENDWDADAYLNNPYGTQDSIVGV